MTDTTDIKALRDAIRYCSIAREMYGTEFQGAKFKLMKVATPELLSSILDQLEAERQRADELKINWEAAKNSIQFYKAEIAALKGDQVPVAFTGSGSLAAIKGGHEGHIWGAPAEAHPVPLYDRPQKPVVLPKEIEPWEVIDILDPTANPDDYACCVGADMYNAAIKACRESVQSAGGIVKDGEL